MKNLAVIATDFKYAVFLKESLEHYLSDYGNFFPLTVDEVMKLDKIDADFVLLSAFTIFQSVKQKIGEDCEIIVLSVAMNKWQAEVLKSVPHGTKALLVNFDYRACMHSISCIYNAGIHNIELYPYYGQEEYDRSIKVAITPNEAQLIPEGIEEIYDLGESPLDMNSLYRIAEKLGVYDDFINNKAKEAREEHFYLDSGIERLLKDNERTLDKVEAIIRLMSDGIILVDSIGRIDLANDKAKALLRNRSKVLLNFNIQDVIPEISLNSTKERLVELENSRLVCTSTEIRSNERNIGYIITVTDFDEAEEKQNGIRSKLTDSNLKALYHFYDIVGESEEMRKAKEEAKLMAQSESSVMIYGESGTGKEMFAQSIHNGSLRRKFNFVAVNCAAIPENLLESEMFGYEEGSFTGAKRGGKPGYFQLAHKGTIFLDEIGEMSLQLQSKLLRVLEDKRIIKVGGSNYINVDVRIIAATNKNLYEMMDRGLFREDLFYRLNVLPLYLPPLRKRSSDIISIFNKIAESLGSEMFLKETAIEKLLAHRWRGNVRELRNTVEFLNSKNLKTVGAEDLPESINPKGNTMEHRFIEPYAYDKDDNSSAENIASSKTIIDTFVLNEGRNIEIYREILEVMTEEKLRMGRKKLTEQLNLRGFMFTEGEVRTALSKLSEYGFVLQCRGRGGTMLKESANFLLKQLKSYK